MTVLPTTEMSREEFQTLMGVSHETTERLSVYLDLLIRWNGAVGLVSTSSLKDPWRRHILDSAQLIRHLDPLRDRPIVDFGSGAGLPGLILAVFGCPDVHLIEATGRKVEFLCAAARHLALAPTIHNARIEDITPFPAAVVTARAVAPVDRLLTMARPFLTSDSRCLFHKGQDVGFELTEAEKRWTMCSRRLPSLSDPEGTLLEIRLPNPDRTPES